MSDERSDRTIRKSDQKVTERVPKREKVIELLLLTSFCGTLKAWQLGVATVAILAGRCSNTHCCLQLDQARLFFSSQSQNAPQEQRRCRSEESRLDLRAPFLDIGSKSGCGPCGSSGKSDTCQISFQSRFGAHQKMAQKREREREQERAGDPPRVLSDWLLSLQSLFPSSSSARNSHSINFCNRYRLITDLNVRGIHFVGMDDDTCATFLEVGIPLLLLDFVCTNRKPNKNLKPLDLGQVVWLRLA